MPRLPGRLWKSNCCLVSSCHAATASWLARSHPWARSEADRIQILACIQDSCSCTMMFQSSSPVSRHDTTTYDWLSMSHGESMHVISLPPSNPPGRS